MPKKQEPKNNDGWYKRSAVAKDGKRFYARSDKSNEDAYAKARDLATEYEQSKLISGENTTFEAWAGQWLEAYIKPKSTKAMHTQKKRMLEMYVFPQLRAMRLCDIRPIHVQSVMSALSDKSASFISKMSSTLGKCFKQAVANELISKSPMDAVDRPDGTRSYRRSLTDAERLNFECTARTHRGGTWILTMLYCGLRRGETAALTWNDVDFKNKTITINKSIEWQSKGNQPTLKDPKTKAGVRVVPMPDKLILALKKQKKTATVIFPSAGGKTMTLNYVRRLWASFMRQADIDAGAGMFRNKIIAHAIDQSITPHYLRHTYATDLYRMGIDLKTAQYLLGHSDIQTTANIYTEVSKDTVQDIHAQLNAFHCGKPVADKEEKTAK